jgi:hypothetical protein
LHPPQFSDKHNYRIVACGRTPKQVRLPLKKLKHVQHELIDRMRLAGLQRRSSIFAGASLRALTKRSKVFVKKRRSINFAQSSEEFGSGFVAVGNEIKARPLDAPSSRGTRRPTIDLQAARARLENHGVKYSSENKKVLDDSTPNFPGSRWQGMQNTFYRCAM